MLSLRALIVIAGSVAILCAGIQPTRGNERAERAPRPDHAWQPVDQTLLRVAQPTHSDLMAASSGSRTWHVRYRGATLEVTPESLPRPDPTVPFHPDIDTATMGEYGTQPSQVVQMRNAWFLSYYHGEFGGGLWVFSHDGTVGRRLLGTAVAGIQQYEGDVIATTGSNAPFFFAPLRIHRFALKDGSWREVAHTDFPHNIRALNHVDRHLYGMVDTAPANDWTVFSEIDLAGHVTPIWQASPHVIASNLAISKTGDIAIGTVGYVIVLHRQGNTFQPTWYAPHDCIQYRVAADDKQGLDAHCVAEPRIKPYMSIHSEPISLYWASNDGNWILTRGRPQQLLHIQSDTKHENVPLPPDPDIYFLRVASRGDDAVVVGVKSVWLRRNGTWSRITDREPVCSNLLTLSPEMLWCTAQDDLRNVLVGINFDGSRATATPRADPQLIAAGMAGDVWFSEKDAFIGHASLHESTEFAVTSPLSSISRGRTAVWFTESDGSHYGYIDAAGKVHELALSEPSGDIGITGANGGAWLTEKFERARTIVRHVDENGTIANVVYAIDVRRSRVSADGALWAQNNNWPTIARVTEAGTTTRFELPCHDQRLQLLAGPNNAIWFLSKEPGCSGYIDARSVHVRELPLVETVRYH
jgi:hypothetical protein